MHNLTLIPGDGIGPEITDAVVKILEKAGVEINWDIQSAGADVAEKEGTPLPDRVIESIKKNYEGEDFLAYFLLYSGLRMSEALAIDVDNWLFK